MGLFSKKVKSFTGVDIGTASVKMVQLAKEGKRPRLVTYGFAEESIDMVRDTSEESIQRVVGIIKQVAEKARITSPNIIAALPTFAVFSSILSLPLMPRKDLANAIRWEAKKFVPMPLKEMILDWKLLKSLETLKEERQQQAAHEPAKSPSLEPTSSPSPVKDDFGNTVFSSLKKEVESLDKGKQKEDGAKETSEKKGEKGTVSPSQNVRVLITAAPKTLVSRYMKIFKGAGLQLVSLETEAFALARAIIGTQKGSVMIVDVGSITTDIVIIEDGIPLLNRSIDVGGATLTHALAQSLHIEEKRAEQFKRDIGIGHTTGSADIPRVMEQTLQPIVHEINYSHSLYTSQSGQRVEKIVLVGGSASLPAIDAYLANITGINTYIGDPWSRVAYPEELKPVLDEVGSRLAVAIGLAIREID